MSYSPEMKKGNNLKSIDARVMKRKQGTPTPQGLSIY